MAAVAERFAELDGRFLALALVLQLAVLALRALAWRGVLAAAYPERRIPVFGVGCAYAAGVAVNAFVPARGGEAAKVALVRSQLPGSSVATIASSLSVVLALDTLLGAALMTTLWSLGRAPALPSLPSVGTLPVVAGVIAVVAVVAGLLAVARITESARRFLAAAARGFSVLRSPWTYVSKVLPFQLSAWGCRIAVVYLVLHAFRFEAGIGTAIVLVVFTGVSTAVPVPGGAGTQQVLAVYALQGVASTARAISFSLGMQLGVTAMNTAVGLLATMLLFGTIRPLRAIKAAKGRSASEPHSI